MQGKATTREIPSSQPNANCEGMDSSPYQGLLPAAAFGGSRAHAMAHHHHLGLLLVALLYVCAFSGGLLVAASLALLASLVGVPLATLALAASDARSLAGLGARVAGSAAADLRLARAVAAYAVVKAAVRVALVVRPKIGALASRARSLGADRRQQYYSMASALFFCRAAHFTAVA